MPIQVNVSMDTGYAAEHILFEGSQYHIGRSQDSDVLVNHPQISRSHAKLSANDENIWTIEDTSSAGCYQRGRRFRSLAITEQQTLQLGPVTCFFKRLNHHQLTAKNNQDMWRQQQLAQLSNTFNRCHSSVALLDAARQCLLQTLGCERAALILIDRHTHLHQCVGYQSWMDNSNFTGSRTTIGRCVEQRKPLAIGDIRADEQLASAQSVVRHNIQAALCVPVICEDNLMGVLYADNTQGRQFFTQTDVEFVQSFANFLALRLLFQSIEHNISIACNN